MFRLAFTADPFEVRTACVTAVVAKTDPSIPIPFVRSSLVVTRRSFADLSHITFHLEPAEFGERARERARISLATGYQP